jgi:GT2 family glycosyltransferase
LNLLQTSTPRPGQPWVRSGNNLAAKHARATAWLVLLNPDAFTEPGWLGALVDSARTHPSFAMFGKG